MGECINCQCDLEGGEYVAPWEEGDNEYGYVICPCCGCHNTDWASGDD